MASKEVTTVDGQSAYEASDDIIRKRIEFFASMMDAFMSDFMACNESKDHLGRLIACARLTALASAITVEYVANLKNLTHSETELKVGVQAANQVIDSINRNAEQIAGPGSVEDAVPVPPVEPPDRSKN